METVLDRGGTVTRSCVLEKNNLGLYDLRINEEDGRILVNVRNVSFLRAVSILEENMHLAGREET